MVNCQKFMLVVLGLLLDCLAICILEAILITSCRSIEIRLCLPDCFLPLVLNTHRLSTGVSSRLLALAWLGTSLTTHPLARRHKPSRGLRWLMLFVGVFHRDRNDSLVLRRICRLCDPLTLFGANGSFRRRNGCSIARMPTNLHLILLEFTEALR